VQSSDENYTALTSTFTHSWKKKAEA